MKIILFTVLWALLMLGVLTVLEIPDHNYANSRVVEVCPAHLCSEIVQDMADREPDQALEQILAASIDSSSIVSIDVSNQNIHINNYGLVRRNVLGDGNCLFRAISVGLHGHENYFSVLRQIAISYIREHESDFINSFIPGTMTSELDRLSLNGEYAGLECIVALSRHFQININVIQGGGDGNRVSNVLADDLNPYSSTPITLLYTGLVGGHYDIAVENPLLDQPVATQPQYYQSIKTNLDQPVSEIPLDQSVFETPLDLFTTEIPLDQSVFETTLDQSVFETPLDRSMITEIPLNQAVIEPPLDQYVIEPPLDQYVIEPPLDQYVQSLNDHNEYSSQQFLCKKPRQQKSWNCVICNQQCSTNFNLKRHTKIKHTTQPNPKTRALISCSVDYCKLQFSTVTKMVDHLKNNHQVEIKTNELKFQNETSFLTWKSNEEDVNNVVFIRQNSKNTKNKTYKSYVCNRSGVHTHKNEKRAKNKKGSCKIGSVCPARMNSRVRNNNTVSVQYTQTHFHSTGIEQNQYHRIKDSVRLEISSKISMGVPDQNIINNLREDIGNLDERQNSQIKSKHFISSRDVRNIKHRQIKVSNNRDSDDATSVHLRIGELQRMSNNPILLYKQQHVIDPSIRLKKEDFMIILMTTEQSNVFQQYAPHVICIDSTHGTTQYKFYLTTVLVIDDNGKGAPVAFCISNREDENSLTVFMEAIKHKNPTVKIDSLVTDDAHASINAVRSVFGSHVHHYLCVFHVISNWNRKLKQYGNTDSLEIDAFRDSLKGLIYTTSQTDYLNKLQNLRQQYSITQERFLNYLDQFYSNRPEKWSLYARKEGLRRRITTNNHLESFHKTLKYNYLSQKCNRRVDKLIDVLIQFEKNLYIEQFKSKVYQKSIDTSHRHETSLSIPNSSVEIVNEITYSVLSSDSINTYYVTVLCDHCTVIPCYMTCSVYPCHKLCIHLYKCSCRDVNNCCKHIHKIHSFRNNQSNTSLDADSFPTISSTNLIEPGKSNGPLKHTGELRRFRKNIEQLTKEMNNKKLNCRLKIVNTALETLLSDNTAYTDISDKMSNLTPKMKIPANKKIEKQLSFKTTQKKRACKSKKITKTQTCNRQSNTVQQTSELQTGSVQPYRLEPIPPSVSNTQLSNDPNPPNLFSNGQGISIPSNLRVPPSLKRIKITDQNGKPFIVILGSNNTNEK